MWNSFVEPGKLQVTCLPCFHKILEFSRVQHDNYKLVSRSCSGMLSECKSNNPEVVTKGLPGHSTQCTKKKHILEKEKDRHSRFSNIFHLIKSGTPTSLRRTT